MTSSSMYHELTKAVNIPGFFVTKFESYPDRIRLYIQRRSHVARCSRCGRYSGEFYDSKQRVLRDFNWVDKPCFLALSRVRLFCRYCWRVRVEKLPFASKRGTFTTRFENSIVELARYMTRADVALHFGVSEDTVGRLEWRALQNFKPTRSTLKGLKQLRCDEIAKRKGHNYVTVITDALTGRVVWVADGRRQQDLDGFFKALGPRGCLEIEAVCIDMSRSYIPAFEKGCPNAKIVFDRFHIVKHFHEAMNAIRKSDILKSPESEKTKWRYSRHALGKDRADLTEKQSETLAWMLKEKPMIAMVYQLKSRLSKIWEVPTLRGAKISLTRWIQRANKIESPAMKAFCKMLERHRRGILNYHLYQLTNGPQEGFNNKLNVLRRRAYGFRNVDWYSLKIFQASMPKESIHT